MELKKILEDVKNNELDIDSALEILKDLPYEDLGYAHIDHHRSIRNGYPEVIYCKGKSDEHILGIIDRMNKKNTNILGTRCRKETFEKIIKIYPNAEYEELSQILKIKNEEIKEYNSKTKGIKKLDFRYSDRDIRIGNKTIFWKDFSKYYNMLNLYLIKKIEKIRKECYSSY